METVAKLRKRDRKFEKSLDLETKKLLSKLTRDMVTLRKIFKLSQAEVIRKSRTHSSLLAKVEHHRLNTEFKTAVRLGRGYNVRFEITVKPRYPSK